MTRGHRILLVEDNPDDVALALRAFEKAQFDANITVVENGEEALHYLFTTGRGTRGSHPTRCRIWCCSI